MESTSGRMNIFSSILWHASTEAVSMSKTTFADFSRIVAMAGRIADADKAEQLLNVALLESSRTISDNIPRQIAALCV